jgi:hypothetical protein
VIPCHWELTYRVFRKVSGGFAVSRASSFSTFPVSRQIRSSFSGGLPDLPITLFANDLNILIAMPTFKQVSEPSPGIKPQISWSTDKFQEIQLSPSKVLYYALLIKQQRGTIHGGSDKECGLQMGGTGIGSVL